jgi:hypothetical protein
MKPTSAMNDKEAACFVNLKKAMNDSYIVNDYLENARHLSPNIDLHEDIAYVMTLLGVVQSMIEQCVKDLTEG